jgi:translocation and assembly module TamA
MRRFACRTAVALTLILGLAPSYPRAADPQPYVVDLRPTGDKDLDAALRDSAALISLREKAPAGGFALIQRARDDTSRFTDALRSFGYYKATIQVSFGAVSIDDPGLDGIIDRAPAAPPLKIVVTIDPGPRFHLGPVTIDGTVPPGAKVDLDLKPGQDALAARVLAARDQLLGAVREAGYPLATVALPPAVVHLDQDQLDVTFHVESGPRAVLGQINFSGLRHLTEAYLRRRLTLRPGELFRPSSINAAQTNLASIPAVAGVRIEPAPQLDPAGNLPLNVEVTERPLHAVAFGAAYSTDIGVSLNTSWTNRDLFGAAEQLILTATAQLGGDAITKPGYQVGAEFIKPDFLMRDQTLDVNVKALDQNLLAYDQTGLFERAGLDRKLSPHWTLGIGVMAEQENIVQVDVSRDFELVGFPVSLKYDSTNNVQDPTAGVRGALTATPVQAFGKTGATYFIAQLSGSAYFDLLGDARSVVAIRGLVGQVSGVGVFGMPPDQRFYAGGTDTVRGYRFQSVGAAFPTSSTTPIGGTAISAGSVEFRQRFLENWGAVGFIDIGQVSTDGKPFDSNWHAGAGVGARYYSVIGPIRLDIAVPLNREPSGDSFEVYIGLGQAF